MCTKLWTNKSTTCADTVHLIVFEAYKLFCSKSYVNLINFTKTFILIYYMWISVEIYNYKPTSFVYFFIKSRYRKSGKFCRVQRYEKNLFYWAIALDNSTRTFIGSKGKFISVRQIYRSDLFESRALWNYLEPWQGRAVNCISGRIVPNSETRSDSGKLPPVHRINTTTCLFCNNFCSGCETRNQLEYFLREVNFRGWKSIKFENGFSVGK